MRQQTGETVQAVIRRKRQTRKRRPGNQGPVIGTEWSAARRMARKLLPVRREVKHDEVLFDDLGQIGSSNRSQRLEDLELSHSYLAERLLCAFSPVSGVTIK